MAAKETAPKLPPKENKKEIPLDADLKKIAHKKGEELILRGKKRLTKKPEVISEAERKKLKQEVYKEYDEAIRLMQKGQFMEALEHLELIIENRNLLSKIGITVDKGIFQEAFLCASKSASTLKLQGLEMLNEKENIPPLGDLMDDLFAHIKSRTDKTNKSAGVTNKIAQYLEMKSELFGPELENELDKLVMAGYEKKWPEKELKVYVRELADRLGEDKLAYAIHSGMKDDYEFSIITEEEIKSNSKKIFELLPLFTASLIQAKKALKLIQHLSEAKKMPAQIETVLQSLIPIDNALAQSGFNELLINSQNLTKEEKRVIASFFENKAMLLNQALLKRKNSIWEIAQVSDHPQRSSVLEAHNRIRSHEKERVFMGMENYGPLDLINRLIALTKKADLPLKKEISETALELTGILNRFKEMKEFPKPDYPVTNKKLKRYADFISNFENKINELRENLFTAMHINKLENKEFMDIITALGPMLQSKDHLTKALQASKPKQKTWRRSKTESEIAEQAEGVQAYLDKIKKNPEGSQAYTALFDYLAKIEFDDREALRKKYKEADPEVAKQITPDKIKRKLEKDEKESIDPRAEMFIYTSTIDFFLKAIEMDPEMEENYKALLDFLDKIDFDKGQLRKGVEEKLRKRDFGKLKQYINTQINSAINIQTHLGHAMPKAPSALRRLLGTKESTTGFKI